MSPRSIRRVLMTADAVGGVWTYALELASGLAQTGTETVLAVMGPAPSAEQRRAAETIQGLILVCGDYALEWMPDCDPDIAPAGDWLLSLERQYGPDIVHLNGYVHAVLPWRAPRLVVAHSCVASWWRAVHRTDPPTEWDGYRAHVAAGLRAADAVVAPTHSFAMMLEAVHGPLAGVQVIRNGRGPDGFAPARKEPIVFAAGRAWDEAKNIAALIEVADGVGWPVFVAGDPSGPHRAQAHAIELAPTPALPRKRGREKKDRQAFPSPTCLRGREGPAAEGGGRVGAISVRTHEPLHSPSGVTWLGPLDTQTVAGWMARAAVYAAPARYEPFGLSVLEAALSGCALVLSDLASFRELWGGAARFVPLDDPVALREALAGLMADPAEASRLGQAARARAVGFGAAQMVDGYRRVYSDLLASRTGRRTVRPVPALQA